FSPGLIWNEASTKRICFPYCLLTLANAITPVHYRRRLKPESSVTRAPTFDGTTATLTGMFIAPARNVTPAASTSAVPAGVILGPTPNSAPSRVRTPTNQLRLG